MNYDFPDGHSLQQIFAEMARLASQHGVTVTSEANGFVVTARPGEKACDVARDYAETGKRGTGPVRKAEYVAPPGSWFERQGRPDLYGRSDADIAAELLRR
jgi:hypothetical protein